MNFKSTRHSLQHALDTRPELADVITELKEHTHACRYTAGKLLSGLVEENLLSAPMFVVYSKRMPEDWRPKLTNGRPYPIFDGFVRWDRAYPYWAWESIELTFAFEGIYVMDTLCDAFEEGKPVLVAWIGEQVITVDEVRLDQGYLDLMSEAFRVRSFPRFSPDESYVQAKLAELPPPLSSDEERFIGGDGETIYVIPFV